MHGTFHCAIWGSGWPGWDRHNHESCRCEGMQVNISCDPIEQLFGWWVFNMFPTLAPLIALRIAPGLEIVADVLETEVLQLEIMEFHHRISESSASKISQSTGIFFMAFFRVWRYSPDTLFDLTVWLHFHKALLFQQKPTEDGSMVHGSVKPVRFCLDCVLWETLEETRKLQSNAIKDIIFSNNSRSHQLLNPSFFEANGLESGSKADMLRLIEKSAFGSQLVGRGFSSGIRLDCWSDW